MSIKLSKLPFSIDSLEPFISSETIYFHFEKHHAGYVNTLNKLIEGSAYDRLGLSEIMLISAKIPGDKKIFKNAAQVWNHNLDQINKKRVSFSPEHNHTKENTL